MNNQIIEVEQGGELTASPQKMRFEGKLQWHMGGGYGAGPVVWRAQFITSSDKKHFMVGPYDDPGECLAELKKQLVASALGVSELTAIENKTDGGLPDVPNLE